MSRLYSQKNKNLLEKLLRSPRGGIDKVRQVKLKPQSYLSKVNEARARLAIELADFAKVYNKPVEYFMIEHD